MTSMLSLQVACPSQCVLRSGTGNSMEHRDSRIGPGEHGAVEHLDDMVLQQERIETALPYPLTQIFR